MSDELRRPVGKYVPTPPPVPYLPDDKATNPIWWAGLIASVAVAVAAQAHTLPEPWSHVVSILGTIGASVNGYLIRR